MTKTEDALFKWMTEHDIRLLTAIRRSNGFIDVHYFTNDDEQGNFIIIEADDN